MLAQIATALLAFASHHKLEDAKEAHLWAGRADAPMLPPNDIGAEASQIADVVIRWALELYEYKIPLAEWRPLPW